MSFLDDILSNLRNTTGMPFTFEAGNVDNLFKYLKTIDWSETWLLCLVAFHLTVTFLILVSGRVSNFQVVLFLILLGLVSTTERLNELGYKHWRSFSMEQYFDSDGVFIGIVFAGPVLLNCCLILLLWLYESYLMIINLVRFKKLAAVRGKEKRSKTNESEKVTSEAAREPAASDHQGEKKDN